VPNRDAYVCPCGRPKKSHEAVCGFCQRALTKDTLPGWIRQRAARTSAQMGVSAPAEPRREAISDVSPGRTSFDV